MPFELPEVSNTPEQSIVRSEKTVLQNNEGIDYIYVLLEHAFNQMNEHITRVADRLFSRHPLHHYYYSDVISIKIQLSYLHFFFLLEKSVTSNSHNSNLFTSERIRELHKECSYFAITGAKLFQHYLQQLPYESDFLKHNSRLDALTDALAHQQFSSEKRHPLNVKVPTVEPKQSWVQLTRFSGIFQQEEKAVDEVVTKVPLLLTFPK